MRLLILQLFFSLSICAQDKSVTLSETTRTERKLYSLEHPKNWMIDTSKVLGMDLFIRSLKTDSVDDFFENVNVFAQDLKGQGYSLERIATESESQIKNLITDIEIVENKIENNIQQPYYRLRYKGRQGKFLLTTIQQYYFKNDIGYVVTLTIKSGEEDKFVPIGEKIFASFLMR